MTILTLQNGEPVVLLRALSTYDDSDTASTCVLDLTPSVIRALTARAATFDEVHARHVDVTSIRYAHNLVDWWPTDEAEDPIPTDDGDEVALPDWDRERVDTECNVLDVSETAFEFIAMPRRSSETLNAFLWRADLDKLIAALNTLKESTR